MCMYVCMHVFLCTTCIPGMAEVWKGVGSFGTGLNICLIWRGPYWPLSALEFFLNYIYCSGYPSFSSEKNVFQNHLAEPGLEYQPSPALLLRLRNRSVCFVLCLSYLVPPVTGPWIFLPVCTNKCYRKAIFICLSLGKGCCIYYTTWDSLALNPVPSQRGAKFYTTTLFRI